VMYGWNLYQSLDLPKDIHFAELRCADAGAALLCGWSEEPLMESRRAFEVDLMTMRGSLDTVLDWLEGRIGPRLWIEVARESTRPGMSQRLL
jgi:hypothetical protein